MIGVRRWVVAVVVVACVAAQGLPAAAAASPPNISAVHYNQPGAFQTDTPFSVRAAGSPRGLDVAWSDQRGDVWLERRNPSGTPLGPPISISRVSGPGQWSYLRLSTTVGDGHTLITTVRDITRFGFIEEFLAWVVSPTGVVTPVFGASVCLDAGGDDLVEMSGAWNGSRFLLAATCPSRTETLIIDTDGTFSTGPDLPIASAVSVASAGSGFLAAYDTKESSSDIVAQRFTGAGALAGGPITVAGGTPPRHHPSVAASGGTYLVAWDRPANGTDISTRTVSAGGLLGTTRSLTTQAGDQFEPSVAPSSNGTWQVAWKVRAGSLDHIEGTKVASSGAPVTPGGADLTPTFASIYHQAFVVGGLPGGASEVFFKGNAARRIAATGTPGATISVTRAPFDHDCVDVAAGPNQFLSVWQELREPNNPNLFGQRYNTNGDPIGGVFTISSAPGDQFCPTVAWGAGSWLVTWVDARNGTKDIFGASVSTAGAITPSNGFPISTAAGVQQSNEISFDGTNFVVVWNDGRNGNQDIFAARVTPARQVLDPAGLAVTTAAGVQRVPLVASAGGRSLIAWQGVSTIDRRLLRGNGTFATGVATLVDDHFHQPEHERFGVAASPSAFALVHRGLSAEASVTIVNRTTGNVVRELPANPENFVWDGADITFDGDNFVVGAYGEPSDPRFEGVVQVRTVAADLMSVSAANGIFWLNFRFGLRLSGHSGGRSLMVGIRGSVTASLID